MFQNSVCELVTKTVKDSQGISIELNYYIHLNSEELLKLKEFREKYANTSSVHFNFKEGEFFFSQKKYIKKSQFIAEPPKLDELEMNFLKDIKVSINQYKNLLQFDEFESLEKRNNINLDDILK